MTQNDSKQYSFLSSTYFIGGCFSQVLTKTYSKNISKLLFEPGHCARVWRDRDNIIEPLP